MAEAPLSIMLKLEKYSADNAEIILQWRNSPAVRQNSKSQDVITFDQHMSFLDKLAQSNDLHYYLVMIDDAPVATINFQEKSDRVYWGCAIGGGDRIVPGLFPFLVGLSGKFTFEILDKPWIESEVLKHNEAPQKLNGYLGIVPTEPAQGDDLNVVHYKFSKEKWPSVYESLNEIMPKRFQYFLKNLTEKQF